MVGEHLLSKEYTRFAELRRRLVEADPEIDETTLLDTLEGATNLHEAIGEVVRAALDEEALADGLKRRLGRMNERLDRIASTSARKRQVALDVMEEAGIEKILEPDFTVSLRTAPPSVVVTDPELIPEFCWIPQPPKLDRKRVLEALKAGTAITGATLSNSKVCLAIRTNSHGLHTPQLRKLRSRLKPRHVRLREAEGQTLHYLEGWHVVAEANRIFGFDGWDRETLANTCVWTKQIGARYCAAYVARVRITVRAGDTIIIREGSGAAESNEASLAKPMTGPRRQLRLMRPNGR